jgi:hypothetical protein
MQPTQLVLCSKDSRYNSLNNILQITNTCAHHIIEDLIDITPDHSKYVYYCEKCYECFTSKEYIENLENLKTLHIPSSGFQ